MNRRIAVIAVVALVALSGCSGLFDGGMTPDDPQTTVSTTTSPSTTATTGSQKDTFPPGIDGDGRVTDFGALVDAHSQALAESGYATSTRIVTRNREREGARQTLQYAATVESGGAPYLIEVNTSIGGEPRRNQTIWGNDSVRYQRLEEYNASGENPVGYDRQSRGVPRADPGIQAFQQVLIAGDFRVTDVSGSGADRRITLVADAPREDALAGTGTNVSDYQGELVVDGEGRIRQATIEMRYTDARGNKLVSEIAYEIDREGGVSVSTPAWIQEAAAATVDVTLEASDVDGEYIAVTNTGSQSIPADHRLAIASESGATVLELDAPVAPGETVYVYQSTDDGLTLSREEPSGDVDPLSGAFRLVVVSEDGDQIADVVVEVG